MDRPLTRREALLAATTVTAGFAGCLGAETGTRGPSDGTSGATTSGGGRDTDTGTARPSLDGLRLRGEPVVTGLTSPLGVATPAPGRHLVADQAGRIHSVVDGRLREAPLLDLTDRMVSVSGYTERGLLGLALHPDFAENGRLFVRYSAPPREGTPDGHSHTFVLSEFRASDGGVDPDSERTILEIPEPQSNHNAGDIAFGPDGYLYVGVGDGGGANDRGPGHVEDWYELPGGNGQDVTENLLGSLLRIGVDGSDSTATATGETWMDDPAYAVPDDNPLVGEAGFDEQCAWGFRNPWRFSFGPAGRLFVADVGQRRYEEVNLVERGGNYGWNVREGRHCFGISGCPTETPEGRPLRDPIMEYPHEGEGVAGISVIGGHVYTGEAIPALAGRYVFADWQAEGTLFVGTETADGWRADAVPIEGIGPSVHGFARLPSGELLVCTTEDGRVGGSDGAVYRIRQA